eukprot:1336075-Prymnesium_polylepis.1
MGCHAAKTVRFLPSTLRSLCDRVIEVLSCGHTQCVSCAVCEVQVRRLCVGGALSEGWERSPHLIKATRALDTLLTLFLGLGHLFGRQHIALARDRVKLAAITQMNECELAAFAAYWVDGRRLAIVLAPAGSDECQQLLGHNLQSSFASQLIPRFAREEV